MLASLRRSCKPRLRKRKLKEITTRQRGNLQRPPYWIPKMQCDQNLKVLRLRMLPCAYACAYASYV